MKRLFIAINLPEKVKNEIDALTRDIPLEESGRWMSPENWHFTVSFLGDQPEEKIGKIAEAIKETANNFSAPEINLEKAVYGPPFQPRMIWLAGSEKTSGSLGEIKRVLELKLSEKGIDFEKEQRKYFAHITLARFKFPVRNARNLDQIPPLGISFPGKSMDLMESSLKETGAEYQLIEAVDFR